MGFLSLEWVQYFGKKEQTLPDLSNFFSCEGRSRRVTITKLEGVTELRILVII